MRHRPTPIERHATRRGVDAGRPAVSAADP
ncbi:hypothetical protein M218_22870 [Burkholderia pseudomallei MSHR338]|nr:hypothetical protein M218_22870 [Burkholderia pseudomallei MSHR338]